MIRTDRLTRTVGGRDLVHEITLDIRRGEIFTLIGPSGSGKTTLLRLFDLLESPTSGSLLFDGEDTATTEAGRLAIRRRMGMVFQKPAVLTTTVEENIAYGLKFRGMDGETTRRRVEEALALVGLAGFEKRLAPSLSGGEMQRVAIARAMVTHPEVLLLDEPTANLDPVSAELIEDLIVRINRKFKTTIVMSTHDMIQGQRLADRIGVIIGGRLEQTGTSTEIFYQPKGRGIARLVGIEAIAGGIVAENDGGHALIRIGDVCIEAMTPLSAGNRAVLCIRPEEVTLEPADNISPRSSVRNRLSGRITKMRPQGPFIRVFVESRIPLVSLITRRSCTELGLVVGSAVIAGIKASAIHVLADDDPDPSQ